MGVHLQATCEQLEGKKKEKQGNNQKSKDFNMQQRSTNKKKHMEFFRLFLIPKAQTYLMEDPWNQGITLRLVTN